ncbi:MAG: hypothetical protein FWE28_02535 [Oscillospiraceae bacterium]|nr:hypothetical protein [Oscillospiraceae bacterium]
MNQELHGTYAIEHNHTKVGQLTVSAAGIRTHFQAECVVVTGEVLRLALLVGEQYIPLGVMRPEGDKFLFGKRYSRLELQTKGIAAIHGVRLMAVGQHAPPPEPMEPTAGDAAPEVPSPVLDPAIETHAPEPAPVPEPIPEPILIPEPELEPKAEPVMETPVLTPLPAVPVSAPTPEAEPPEGSPVFTHEARFTASLPVADRDLDDIDPYPATRPVVAPAPDWSPCPNPAALFTDPNLIAAGRRLKEARTRPMGAHTELAVPFDTGKPFPLMPIFCLGQVTDINGQAHLVFQVKDGNIV